MGRKSVSGASVGILMLDARFPRIPGDIGNARTWPFPVRYRIVPGALPDRVVRRNGEGLLGPFVDAARQLVADGVGGITTTCGFLSLFQEELARALPVPVATSSLMQVGMVNQLLGPGRRAGILSICASALTPAHLQMAHVPPDTPIGTTEGGAEFTRAILGNEPDLDVDLARRDNVAAALALQGAHPDLGAIVLECTNMGPYASDIARETGLPVFSVVSFITWFQSGLAPARYR